MRSATKEERESVDRYIKSIAHKTGISLCDICSNFECVFQSGIVREQCDFYKKKTQQKDGYYQAIIDVLEIIDKTSFAEERGEFTVAYNTACKHIKMQVLALKGEQE